MKRSMHVLALLCLGLIGKQSQALKMSTESEEKLETTSKSMISNLEGSELDLKSFSYHESQEEEKEEDKN